MFNGVEKKRIEELEAALTEKQEIYRTDLDRLGAEWEEETRTLKEAHAAERLTHEAEIRDLKQAHANELLRIGASHDQDIADYNRQIAVLEGKLDQSEKYASKWWALANGWRWHKGGSKEIEGIVYTLFEARTDDPTINTRMFVREGVEFP